MIVAAALAGCHAAVPPGPLAGSSVGGPYQMIDQDGRRVTDRTYAGKYRLMYFGYTFCPDVCPVDAQKMAQGIRLFSAHDAGGAAQVVPIFVTVDPERDTPAVLKTFVRAFSPQMVGLTGSVDEAAAMRKAFRIYAAKSGQGRDYLVDHSATIYLMDPDNRPISFLEHDATPATIATELATYVH